MGNYKFTMNAVFKTKGSPNKWASWDNRSELVSFIFLVGGSILRPQVVTVLCSWYKDKYNYCYSKLCQAINIYDMLVCRFNKFANFWSLINFYSLCCTSHIHSPVSNSWLLPFPSHFISLLSDMHTEFLIVLWHSINITWLTSTIIHIKL